MKDKHLKELQDISDRLMIEQASIISQGNGFYSLEAHEYLQTQRHYGGVSYARSIMLPMSRGAWYPKDEWKIFDNFYANAKKQWPSDSHFFYAMDSLVSKVPGLLYFGYAICDNKLWPCAFFMQFLMTLEIEDIPGELFPEEYIIDPMALASGKKPDCYIGVFVPTALVEEWLLSNKQSKHLLEKFANQENLKILEESNWHKEILYGQHRMLDNVSEKAKDRVIKWLLKE